MYIIYGLIDPRTNEIRYIGLSRQGKARPRQHAYPSHRNRPTPVACWVRSLLAQGIRYQFVILEECKSREELAPAEIKWITDSRARGCRLLNLTDGGEGLQNPSQEVRDKMSAQRLGTKRPPRSEEWCRNISLSRKGMKPSPEAIEKRLQKLRGRPLSEAHKASLRAAKEQQRAEGRLVVSAEQKEKIAAAARDQWVRQARPIRDVDTGIIYGNQRLAAAAVGASSEHVWQVVNGRARSAKGHRFEFAK